MGVIYCAHAYESISNQTKINRVIMTRSANIFTGRYALAFPKNGKLQLVFNTDNYTDKRSAELNLSDRKANGEAFPGEQVVEVWASLQWFGQHSGGTEPFNAYLFAKPIAAVSKALKTIRKMNPGCDIPSGAEMAARLQSI